MSKKLIISKSANLLQGTTMQFEHTITIKVNVTRIKLDPFYSFPFVMLG